MRRRRRTGRRRPVIVLAYCDLLVPVVRTAPRSGSAKNHLGCTREQSVARCPRRGIWYIELRNPTIRRSSLTPQMLPRRCASDHLACSWSPERS